MNDKLTVEGELNDIEVDSQLTPDETLLLEGCEREIAAGLKIFYQVGVALMTIRDRRLYRASYRTFKEYLRERWHFRKSQGYRLIDAVEPYQVVAAHSNTLPTAERQLRPLQKIPREQWPEAWKTAENLAEENHTKLAVSHVERAVELLLPKTTGGPRRISLRLCFVCAYSFSDEHHIKPRSSGGKHFESISLCPNHHRYATLMQHMLDRDYARDDIEAYARRFFDPPFNEKLLNKLLDRSYHLSSALTDSLGLFLDQTLAQLNVNAEDHKRIP